MNLRRARKAQARERAAEAAAQNREIHGRSAAERRADAAEGRLRDRRLDQHRLGGDASEAPPPGPGRPLG